MLNKINYRVSDDINFWIDEVQYVKNHLSVYEEVKKKDITRLSEYIFEKYYKISKHISVNLNNFHKTNYDDYFWRKTFNYGLLMLITELHQHFNFLEKNYNPSIHLSNILSERSFKTSDTFEDQRIFLQSDLGYEQIFSLYIRFKKEKFNKEILLVKKNKLELFNNSKRFVRNLKLRFSFRKNVKTLICNSYFEKNYLKTILKKNNLIDHIFYSKIFFFNIIDPKTRKEIFEPPKNSDYFDKFLYFSLRVLFPKIYLEGFKRSIYLTESILNNFPSLENIVSEAWITNTPSSFMLAIAKERGIIHYCNEHNSFTHPFLGSFLKLSIELSDIFLTLGWDDIDSKIIRSSSLYKFKIKNNFKKTNKILFVAGPLGRNFPIYSTCYGSCGYFTTHVINFNNKFFSEVTKSIPNSILFRNYPNYKSKQIKLLNPIYDKFIEKFNLESDSLNSSCLEEMSRSELIIIDYISTSFIEALVSNFPVIIFLTPGYILDTKYIDFFNPLIESGIIQTCPKTASDLVVSVYENPIMWWKSEKIQTARELFLKNNLGNPEIIKNFILNLNKK